MPSVPPALSVTALLLLCLLPAPRAEAWRWPWRRTPAEAILRPLAATGPLRLEIDGLTVEVRGLTDNDRALRAEAEAVLRRQIALANDRTMTPPLADDLAFFLRGRLLQLGWPDAETEWSIAGGIAILEARPGTRYHVGDIEIEGESTVPKEDLVAYVTRQTAERERGKPKALPFVKADIEEGVSLVKRRLQADGYLRAEVSPPVYEPDGAAGRMRVSLSIQPGQQYRFGEITLLGELGNLREEALKQAEALRGLPYNAVNLENLRKNLQGRYESEGHFLARVEALADPEAHPGGTVPATLSVAPGPLFTVAGVEVEPGVSEGGRRVATAVFGAAANQVYTPDSLDLLNRRALDTGVFSRLDVEPVVTGPDTLTLRVKGEEAPPRTVGFYGGFETFRGPILGAEWRHVNFQDTGNALSFRLEGAARGLDGGAQWQNPAFLGSPFALSTDLFAQTFTFADYTRYSAGLRGTLTRRFTRRVSTDVFASISLNESESDTLNDLELGPDSYQIATAGGRVTFDFRDSPLVPRRGWMSSAAVEGFFSAGGSDVSFVRTDLAAAYYRPLTGKWRFALGAKSSAISGVGDFTDLPIDLRVFNGGANSVRGYPEREMGPMAGDTPLGGTMATVFNLELSREILSNLEIAAFTDVGSLSQEESSVFAMPEKWRYSVGLGMRYNLPIGPLRVDCGVNPERKDGDPWGAVHVTFGFAF